MTYLEGKAEGKATLILRLLESRGVAVPEDDRERITGCTDLDVLDRWFDRAITAPDADALFVEDESRDGAAAQAQRPSRLISGPVVRPLYTTKGPAHPRCAGPSLARSAGSPRPSVRGLT